MSLLTRASVRMEQVACAMRCGAMSAIVSVVTAALISDAVAQQSWKPELRLQLEEEHGCELVFFTNVQVRDVNGLLFAKVRAHCRDGRAFDAERDDSFMAFEIRPVNTYVKTHSAPSPAVTRLAPARATRMMGIRLGPFHHATIEEKALNAGHEIMDGF